METAVQRRELEGLSQALLHQSPAAAAAADRESSSSSSRNLLALERENAELRQQLAELSAAIGASAADKKGGGALPALLASQLRSAHRDLVKLRSSMRAEQQAAAAAETNVGAAMRALGRGAEVFAADPNDCTLQQAALDSQLVKARRRVLAAREFVWSAVATLKDLIDQTFERVGRLVKSEVPLRQKSAYLNELQALVTSQLDPALKVYNDLDAVFKELENLKAVVFDPRRNNPYCPCRPRRMVLEDDLEHLQQQLQQTSEALRRTRTELIKSEMEGLQAFVQDKVQSNAAANPFKTSPQPAAAAAAADQSPAAAAAAAAYQQQQQQQQQQPAAEEEETTEILLLMAQRQHEAAKVAEALAALKDEVEMLKDRAMCEEASKGPPEKYLAEELFSREQKEAAMQKDKKPAGSLEELQGPLREGRIMQQQQQQQQQQQLQQQQQQQHPAAALQQAAAALSSFHFEKLSGPLDPKDLQVLKMIEEQAAKMHKMNEEMRGLSFI
ncbi:hypothetical protein, conserved [Eimeria tenella]|uniref:Uncharacterized protein n=1 Tax=Eimeria tenella TaxID=5802 RepID=U6L1G7_EIMTE|nr:hypothetical protein, conserved [Eimeria tenella]CDJ42414.1 hypothetical protein, conserved [Eimeria tenella]|eukprot:XP_013233164.1 hypothetical protein, conserved [Eimeria tenella]